MASIFKKFQPIASAFAPNYTLWDCLIAKKYLFLPWRWSKLQEGKNPEKLEKKFCEYSGFSNAISFDSGRSGFYAILKCLGIKDYDEVILQAFTTVALPNAIIWCGAKPVFIDINEKTYNIDPKKIEKMITAKTRAIVIQHTFGNPSEIAEIMMIAKKHNLFVIEDCAHSLGAEYNGKPTGTFADASFFSFGRDKIISSISGGMVATNNQDLGEKIRKFKEQMPFPKRSHTRKQLLHPLITFVALRSYYFFGLGKILMLIATRSGILTKAYSKKEKANIKPENFPAKMPNSLAEIALHQFRLIDKFNDHRIKIANFYKDQLQNTEGIGIPATTPRSKNVFLWYTVLAENKLKIIEYAKKDHIILGDWFPRAIGPIETDLERSGYKKGSCPIAESVSSRCINLPTNRNVDLGDARKVAEMINKLLVDHKQK